MSDRQARVTIVLNERESSFARDLLYYLSSDGPINLLSGEHKGEGYFFDPEIANWNAYNNAVRIAQEVLLSEGRGYTLGFDYDFYEHGLKARSERGDFKIGLIEEIVRTIREQSK